MSSVESFVNNDLHLVRVTGSVGGKQWPDITTKELVLGESLLNPGLMASITFHSMVYGEFNKVYMDLKNTDLSLNLYDGHGNRMSVSEMKIYRMDNRSMMPLNMGRTEEFTVHATHFTLLEDAKHVMSKKWTCATPDSIVLAICSGMPAISSMGWISITSSSCTGNMMQDPCPFSRRILCTFVKDLSKT